MNNKEAREILGLDPGDNPSAFLSDFNETLEYKKSLVETAPSEELKFRYKQELLEYEAALMVMGDRGRRVHTDFVVVLLLIAALSTVGWWGYQWYHKQWYIDMRVESKITELRAEGLAAVTARKWNLAEAAYRKMDELSPGSGDALKGREMIEQGKREERNQQISYTLGQSQAALEAGQWDEAEKLAKSVFDLAPESEAAQRKLLIIIRERKRQEIALMMETLADALENEEIEAAKNAMATLKKRDPSNAEIAKLEESIQTLAEEIKLRYERAEVLYQQAVELDTGEYSPQAMLFLEEAGRLNPKEAKITALYKKMGAYSRALHVPGDYITIPEAIAAARPRDIIRVAPGKYTVPVYIDRPIKLTGSIEGGTIIELPAKEAAMITVTPTAIGTEISGIELRHVGFDHGKDRFSGITIQAKNVKISSCKIENTAGHGIAVLDGAQAKISNCKIKGGGWDGISVYGENSNAEIVDTWCQNNIQHGIGFWQGGSGSVINARATKNGLCGIVAMGKGANVSLSSNVSSENREAGILLSEGVSAKLMANTCEKNLLSGIVARGAQTQVTMTENITNANRQAGIVTQQGVIINEFTSNSANDNVSRQIWRDAKLTSAESKR